jgi:hypothetical protein
LGLRPVLMSVLRGQGIHAAIITAGTPQAIRRLDWRAIAMLLNK